MTKNQSKVYTHLTWSTKCREKFLKDKNHLDQVLNHITENAVKKGISIVAIGGSTDHVHILIRLSTNISLAKTVMLIKGESSWWIRRSIPVLFHFEWQNGYDARSVSSDKVRVVSDYILNQEEHHAKKLDDDTIEIKK
jgi:putative transposase